MNTESEDLALVDAFKRGEESAYTALVIKYREPVYRIARRMLRNHEDASDVAQEVFIRAYRALPRFAARAAVRTWLYRITVNLCLDLAGRRARGLLAGWSELLQQAAPRGNPGEAVERRELADAVAEAIDALPPRQKAMVILRVYQDLPYAEIGRIMGCAEGTVKATMFAAFGKLRKLLAPYVIGAGRGE
ncbi:MAG: RNA polymerase sigma factor [Armatimonadota bacterium]|nr:RNA polymerase sigma factor [Armatimonadota bacterium]MDR7452151.1 RNA polymerase sigma factor [Armatimonadota bacterium]MDR7551010.1 RNA polymerase sigma factor [Armatimonadota bacterium]